MRLKEQLESPIEYNGFKFELPIDCEMGLNMKDTIETQLIYADDLKDIYERLTDVEKE